MSTDVDARSVLADPAYGFCHDPQYPLTDDEAQWCPLLPVDDPPCPAFAVACDAKRGGHDTISMRSGKSDEVVRERGPVAADRTSAPDPEIQTEPLPAAHVLMWVIVGAMVIALLTQLRGPVRARVSPTDAPPADDDGPGDDAGAAKASAPETDVERLMARAVARAERGELAAAVGDGHAALLRRLAERGHVRLTPSRTNGDHLRDLGGEPTLHAAARYVVRIVERVQFGNAGPSKAEVDGLLAQVRQVLSTLASVVLVMWTALACASHDPRAVHPWPQSPSGSAGVIALLQAHGIEVHYRLRSLDDLEAAGPTPIVLGRATLTDDEETHLLAHVESGGSVVFASSRALPQWLRVSPAIRSAGPLRARAGDDAPAVPGDAGVAVWDHDDAEEDLRVLWADARGTAYAVKLAVGSGVVLVLADGRLLTNGALAIPGNDAAVVALLAGLDDDFELIDEGVRAQGEDGASDPFDAIGRAELTAVIIQLLLFVLLLYLWRGAHFGRPRDPPQDSRRRFGEHVEALAGHYLRAGARRHSLRLYAGWALERIQARFDPQRRGLHVLAGRIASRTGGDQTEIMRILVEAHHARDDDADPHGSDEDLRVLRELGRLVDTTRGPR